jgi:hypothetical protein
MTAIDHYTDQTPAFAPPARSSEAVIHVLAYRLRINGAKTTILTDNGSDLTP